jgi:hypothetical protein
MPENQRWREGPASQPKRIALPIGRLIDSRQYRSKSVEIGDPLKRFLRTLPRPMEAGSFPDLLLRPDSHH